MTERPLDETEEVRQTGYLVDGVHPFVQQVVVIDCNSGTSRTVPVHAETLGTEEGDVTVFLPER